MRIPLRRFWPVAAAALIPLGLAGLALSAVPGPDGSIHACVNKSTGAVRVIDLARRQHCRSSGPGAETALTLNQHGPVGVAGPSGPTGAQGSPGAPGPTGQPGRAGATILSGPGFPPPDVGSVGDFYLDTTTPSVPGGSPALILHGPKATKDWSNTSEWRLAGPPGPQGLQGPPGTPGTLPGVPTCSTAPTITSVVGSTLDGKPPNAGDLVVVHTDTPKPCADSVLRYNWSIVSRPPGSKAQLDFSTAPKPSFVPDVSGDYLLRVIATDSTGLSSEPAGVTISTTSCGANVPTITMRPAVLVKTSAVGPVYSLSADVTSADNDPGKCPTRFATTFSYSWTLTAQPPGSKAQISNPSQASPYLDLSGEPAGSYISRVVVSTGNGTSERAFITIVSPPT